MQLLGQFETRGSKISAAALFALTALSTSAPAKTYAPKVDAQDKQRSCSWIGVRVSAMTRPFADSLGMTTPYGAIFGRPRRGSPAAHAHIESGDLLTDINGAPLSSARDFGPVMSKFAPGTTVYFRTYRSGQLIDRAVTLGYAKCLHRT